MATLAQIAGYDAMAPIQAFEMGHKAKLSEIARRNIGAALQTGDYGAGANAAFGAGEFDTGMSLAKLAEDRQAQQQEAARQQQIAQALGGVLPPQYRGLAQVDPKTAISVFSADQQNQLRQAQLAQTQQERVLSRAEPDNVVTQIGGRQVLVDKKTGSVTKDLGSAPSRTLPANNDQRNAAGFFDRMSAADGIISTPGVGKAGMDRLQTITGNLPIVGNYTTSSEYQQFDQATRDFVNAVLRKESGAAISESEFANARKQYFPQPGDSEAVLMQKAGNRRIAINAMKRSAGPALEQQQADPGSDGTTNQDIGAKFNVPQDAIDELTQDASPQARQEFDAVFGAGASDYVLGPQ